jgi:hypothetical protein
MGQRHFPNKPTKQAAKGTTALFSTVNIIILIAIKLCIPGTSSLNAQTSKSEDSTHSVRNQIVFHGFIKSDIWFDSRQVASARDNLFLLYPLKPAVNSQGHDLNKQPSYNISAITSRVSASIFPHKTLNNKIEGYVEADFSGVANQDIGGCRLRHAYIEYQADSNTRILFGHYWHPFFVTQVFPSVLALNTGAPYQPFIRSPQLRYTRIIRSFQLDLAALAQMDYLSDGPLGRSHTYISNSPVPNLNIRASYQHKNAILGGSIDFKALRPVLNGNSNGKNAVLTSLSYMLYARHQGERLSIKGKYIFGENLSEHLLLGGYYFSYDSTTANVLEIHNTRHHFLWLNPSYALSRSMELGLFAGYARRVNYIIREEDYVYARGNDIDHSYRLSLQLLKRMGDLMLMSEIEHSTAAYGDLVFGEGKLKNVKEVRNIRLQFSAFLFF